MDINKFDQYIAEGKNLDEGKHEKQFGMYRDGAHSLRYAFSDFSQSYMRAMGQLQQGKNAMKNPKLKKMRDTIASAYERMDSAIETHLNLVNSAIETQLDTKIKR